MHEQGRMVVSKLDIFLRGTSLPIDRYTVGMLELYASRWQ